MSYHPGTVTDRVSPPAVSIVVCTRNRPEHIGDCVASILATGDTSFELLVIDQSDSSAGFDIAGKGCTDRRLRWIRIGSRGLSTARNAGVRMARAPVVAFTDDDCRVPVDWVSRIASSFSSDPELSLLFGEVRLRPEDKGKGFAATFLPPAVRELKPGLSDVRTPWGIGANMAARSTVFEAIGTFDPALGAGSDLFAGEEFDLRIRALAAGLRVIETPHVTVVHRGMRSGKDASLLMRGYGVGFGAVLFKHVRLGTPGARRALADWFGLHVWRSAVRTLSGHPTPGFGLLAGVLRGAYRAARRPLGETPRHPNLTPDVELPPWPDESR